MKETKKFTMEQGDKRVILEQGIEDESITKTPKWDELKINLKEGTAEKVTLFGRSFMRSLVPAFFLILGFMLLATLICGR